MSDLKKVALWFLVVLILAVYAKVSGIIPDSGVVLGTKTVQHQETFGDLLKKNP